MQAVQEQQAALDARQGTCSRDLHSTRTEAGGKGLPGGEERGQGGNLLPKNGCFVREPDLGWAVSHMPLRRPVTSVYCSASSTPSGPPICSRCLISLTSAGLSGRNQAAENLLSYNAVLLHPKMHGAGASSVCMQPSGACAASCPSAAAQKHCSSAALTEHSTRKACLRGKLEAQATHQRRHSSHEGDLGQVLPQAVSRALSKGKVALGLAGRASACGTARLAEHASYA